MTTAYLFPGSRMKVGALLVVMLSLLVSVSAAAENIKVCPQLEGKQIKVTGVLHNLMIGGHREPGEAPSSYFELDHPRWDCKLKKVYVDYPGERLCCSEGRRVEVSGTYHEGDLFPGYNVITAREVRCR